MLGKFFFKISASFLCLVSPVMIQAAHAGEFLFTFAAGTQVSNSSNSDGNGRVFKAVTGTSDVKVRVSGWSYDGSKVLDSFGGLYSAGLGVTSADDNGGNNGQHTIDNEGQWDFIILQFDEIVKLKSARFTPFLITDTAAHQNNSGDTDATIAFGNTATPWTQQLNLNNKPISNLNAIFSSYLASNGGRTTNTRSIYSGSYYGNIWLIGASKSNPDRYYDSFKLANLAVSTPAGVPEPGTWAMMILGFAFVGIAMRQRKTSFASS
jgi:PEP-CTERM motif